MIASVLMVWAFLWTLVIICANTGERNSSGKKDDSL